MRQPRGTGAEGGGRLRAGAELEVTVERILPGGVGLAHARGSHRVVDVAECPVAAPAVEERLERLRALMREGRLPEGAQEFEAVAGDRGVSLTPPVEPDDAAEQARTIAGERYRFGAGCFFQINHALLRPLVREGLRDAAGETALDLYNGVGLFTLP